MIYLNTCKRSHQGWVLILVLIVLSSMGCAAMPERENNRSDTSTRERPPINVDVATASLEAPNTVTEYIGTTKAFQEVSVRSQVEGKLIALNVDVGDRLTSGQLIANIDDSLQIASVNRAEAELLALESELAQAESRVNNARTQVERARVELRQAENDAQRYDQLLRDGAISQKEAETFQTNAQIAKKNVETLQEQINIEQKVVSSVLARITAQKAVISQEQQRQGYSRLFSPLNGVVLEKMTEIGNLITSATEIIKIGDFSRVKVLVPVSELELGKLRVGESLEVRFDAFPNQIFPGTLTTISPLIDANNRKLNLEVTINNPDNRIGAGLLARVKFNGENQSKIIIPESALKQNQDSNYVFMIRNPQENQATVEKQTVEIGNIINGKVEILAGLQPEDRFVVRSSQSLESGDRVRLSVLSN
jgi:RND family efflux transporter MFP subunit